MFHYKGNTAPPADHDKWSWFIRTFVRHLLDRYGRTEVRQWFFEVWNEPNLGGPDSPDGFFVGSMEDYFKLYQVTLKQSNPRIDSCELEVPPPPTMPWDSMKWWNSVEKIGAYRFYLHLITTLQMWFWDMAWRTVPILGVPTPEQMEDPEFRKTFREKMEAFQAHLWERVDRGVVTQMTRKAVQEADGLPVYYTEWNSLAGLPSDGPFGSSFIAKTVLDGVGLVNGYSYWTFSDIFEENGMPSAEFHGGFRPS